MLPLFWLILASYLLIAIVILLQTEFTCETEPSAGRVCAVALLYALSWPLRAVDVLIRGG